MGEVIFSLRAAYKKLKREKMVVVLALWFSTSRELLLRVDLVRKNFDLRISKLNYPSQSGLLRVRNQS